MIGQIIGSYRIVRPLGAGGMGAVYEGVHEQLGRRAAIKVLHRQLSHDAEMARRFFNEARSVNLIRHPGIVDVSAFEQLPDGTIYIVMEYLEGESLRERLEREPVLDPAAVVRLGAQIATALAAAHDKGIVHRDLKPDNVMLLADGFALGGERTKLLDFGIAKIVEEGAAPGDLRTRTGALMGTPFYMSPEQCRGAGRVDDRTDVYSLGIMLFQMATGQLPFVAEGLGEVMALHMFRAAPPVAQVSPSVPGELAALIDRMLAKGAADRPSMAEAAAALSRLAEAGAPARAARPAPASQQAPAGPGHPSTLGRSAGQKRPATPPSGASRPRWAAPLGGTLVAMFVLGAGGAALWQQRRGPLPAAPAAPDNRAAVMAASAPPAPAVPPQEVRPKEAPLPAPPPAPVVLVAPPLRPGEVDLLHSVPTSVVVSSTVRERKIQPAQMFDGNPGTAWNSRAGDLVGASVTFTVPDEVRVSEVRLTTGFVHHNQSGDLFTLNYRIRQVALYRGEDLLGTYDLDPEDRGLQVVPVGQPGGTFRLEVRGVVPGTRRGWKEVCISEMQVIGTLPRGRKPRPQAPVVTVAPPPQPAPAAK